MRLSRGAILLAVATAASPTLAAEIVLERSAADRLVSQALFVDQGRLFLRRGACYAYLETPSVELKDGRIFVRSHLSSRAGVEASGNCIGPGFATWTLVSGRPVASGGLVKLDDLRIENVDDAATRLLLQSGLLPALPRAVELDVKKAVQGMLQGASGQLQATVESLDIEGVVASDNKLSVKFNFKLVAR